MSRIERRRRRRRIRALGVAALTSVLGAAAAFAGIAAAAEDAKSPPPPRAKAAAAVDPPLLAASADAQERAVERLSTTTYLQAVAQAAEKAAKESIWDRIAACETQGDWSMRGSTFSGGVGFSNAAWDSWGGREFAPNAGQATREQQIIVAERIRASVGLSAWGCAKRLGVTGR